MPVVLRLCMAVERAAPQPPPTSILATTTAAAAAASSPQAAVSPSPPKARNDSPAAGPSEPTHSAAEEPAAATAVPPPPNNTSRREGAMDAHSPTVAAAGTTSKSGKDTDEPHRRRHRNIFHWLTKRRRNKTEEKTAMPAAASAAPISSAASHQSLSALQTAGDKDGQSRRSSVPAANGAASSLVHEPQAALAAGAAQAVHKSLPTPAGERPEEEMAPPPEPETRSLIWLSVQLTPSSSVSTVMRHVHDAVRRRMGATLSVEGSTAAFSAFTTPAGSFANAPRRGGGGDGAGASLTQHNGSFSSPSHLPPPGDGHTAGDYTAAASSAAVPAFNHAHKHARTGSTATAPVHSVHVVSPTFHTVSGLPAADAPIEWCLCLQDGDGVYHWVGGTRHYPKTPLLRAPFVTDACLQSHNTFEAERHHQKAQQRAHRRAHAQRTALFKGAAGPPGQRRSDGGSSTSSTNSNSTNDSSSSSSGGGSDDSASTTGSDSSSLARLEDEEDSHHGRYRHTHSRSHQRSAGKRQGPGRSSSSPHKKLSAKGDKKKMGKAEGKGVGDGGRSRSAGRTPRLGLGGSAAQKFAAPTPMNAKFAFLRGVVVPMDVLRLRNPGLARHRRKLPLYMEVHVPRDLRTDPFDPSPLTAAAAAAAAPGAARATTAAAVEEKDGPLSVSEGNARFPPPPLASAGRSGEAAEGGSAHGDGAVSATETVDVDPPPPSHSSPLASSASTAPSRSPLAATSRGVVATAAVDGVGDAKVGSGSEGGAATGPLPTGLATHATSLDGLADDGGGVPDDERAAWCRSADAAQIKHIPASLLSVLAGEEDAARVGLARAQQAYAAALTAHRSAVPAAPLSVHEKQYKETQTVASDNGGAAAAHGGEESALRLLAHAPQDAELAALIQRKLALQARAEEGREAERQCAGLTTLVECLERELREQEERRALLLVRSQ